MRPINTTVKTQMTKFLNSWQTLIKKIILAVIKFEFQKTVK